VAYYSDVGSDHYSKDFWEYGLDDAQNTYELYRHFSPIIDSKGLRYLMFKVEMPYQKCLLEMAIEGVVVDKELMNQQQELLVKTKDELVMKLCETLGVKYSMQFNLSNNDFTLVSPINFNSTQQLIKIFKDLEIPITEVTDKGNPSVGKLTLTVNKDHPFVNLLIRYKIVCKLLEGFLEPLPNMIQSDGRVRPYFNDVGARTGRLSCSEPNLQQLPKPKCYHCGGEGIKDGVCGGCGKEVLVNVRSVFKAPPGFKMFSVDYSGQEVAVMAQQSKDPTLVESLNKGYDMHLAIANQFYNLGIPSDCLVSSNPDYEGYRVKFSKERSNAKVITFGLAYGKGSFGFSKDFGISEDEAHRIVDDYFDGMPGLKRAIDNAHSDVRKHGFVRNLAGRYRHFSKGVSGHYSGKDLRQSFNFLIQGFSADMVRAASINVYNRKQHFPEWGLVQVMTVHDENVYLVKEEYVSEATVLVKRAFEDVGKRFVVPLKADVEVGDNYGTAK
jgi:DNA polymerase I